MTITSNTSTITVNPISLGNIKLGILEWYGKISWLQNSDCIINLYKKWIGTVDVWKIGPMYMELEPTEGNFNTVYVDLIKRILNDANTNNIKVQLSITGGYWPSWTGGTNTIDRYTNSTVNQKFANTWKHMANVFKNYPALDTYMLIVEEVNITNALMDDYVNANKVVVNSIRSEDSLKNLDGTFKHKIGIRPDITLKPEDTKTQLYISKNGTHGWDFGRGVYPTGADDTLHGNPSPLSYTSYMKMTVYLRRNPPLIRDQGKHYGIGECGFIRCGTELYTCRPSLTPCSDTFGDTEKLKGFKRLLAISYNMGYEEFDIWSDRFRFSDITTYGPQLKQFRDQQLHTKPKLNRYNLRLVVEDTDGRMGLIKSPGIININNEPYYHLIRRLDEEGFSWFHVTNTTEPYPTNIYDATIKTSEIKGKTIAQQDTIINSRLSGITPTGFKFSWATGDVIF